MNESLLNLVGIQAEEDCLLDEHFRSLPPIIEFSNDRWYGGQLRIMTDVANKRVRLARTSRSSSCTTSKRAGSRAASRRTSSRPRCSSSTWPTWSTDPDYDGASIGVLCLFEEQVALINEMVTATIDPEEWEEHDIVVVNPDGFQGDERDVILYSLSWDNDVMPRAALSARQMDTAHIQGMLNVAFTRARDEIHVFHSAPIDTFTMAGDRPGAIGAWLEHCASVQSEGGQRVSPRAGKVDSAVRGRRGRRAAGPRRRRAPPVPGLWVLHRPDVRARRGAAGGRVRRRALPPRRARAACASRTSSARPSSSAPAGTCCASRTASGVLDPTGQVRRVVDALHELAQEEEEDDPQNEPTVPDRARPLPPPPHTTGRLYTLPAYQGAIMGALRERTATKKMCCEPHGKNSATHASALVSAKTCSWPLVNSPSWG